MNDKIKLNLFSDKTQLESQTQETKQFFAYLIFFEKGSGLIKINNTNSKIEENTISSLPVFSNISYNELNDQVKGWTIAYDKDARDLLLIHSFRLFCPFTGIVNIKMEENLFKKLLFNVIEIKNELDTKLNSYYEIVYLHNTLIIKHINRNITIENSTSQIKDSTLRKFADLVNDEYKSHHDIEYFVNKLAISTKTLNRLAKIQLKITPKQIIQYRINAEAIYLLLHSQKNIKEIAFELNFNSPDYFNFFFKKLNKISPLAYKNKMSENLMLMSDNQSDI